MSSNRIKEYVSAVMVLVCLAVLSIFPVSALSLLCSVASVAILGYLTTKYHYGYVAGAIVCCVIAHLCFSGNLLATVIAMLPAVLCGLTLGISYNLKLVPLKAISISTVVYTLCVTVNLKLISNAAEENLMESVIGLAGQVYREALSASYSMQLSESEIQALVSESTSMMLQFMPALIVMMSFVFSLLAFYLFKRICLIRKCDTKNLVAFSDWRAEKSVSILFFVLLVLSFFLPSGKLLADAVLNVVTVMSTVFYVLGIALIEHFFKPKFKKSWSRKTVLFLIVLATSLLAGIPFLIISIAGAMDGFIDYRRKLRFRG